MTDRIFRSLFTALLVLFLAPVAAIAQASYWVQIEAHATLRTAEDFATRYQQRLGNIAGFRIAGGWYALAMGPFASEDDAETRRAQLLASREIRGDAYVTDNAIYGQQFWPVGGQAAALQPLSVEGASVALAAAPEAEANATADVATTATDTGNAVAQVLAPVQETVELVETATDVIPEAVAETVLAAETEPAPVAEPVAEPEPEIIETLATAQADERQLTRDDRIAIQIALQWFGFYRSGIDAQFGPGTRSAIRNWQTDKGYEPWGFLSTSQRMELLNGYDAAVARYAFAPFRDEAAGIEITLPLGMLQFDRHEAPFAHFSETNDSNMRALLLSQEGSQATLFGLYEILQTLEIIPLEGERDRGRDRFIITGQSATQRAHVEARLQNGQIKGWALFWEPAADADATLVIDSMRDSFRPIEGVLPSNLGAAASTVARRDLIAGLDVRRPDRSRTGFFVDAVGTVVTSAEAVQSCERVTIDEAYGADIRTVDAANGIAVLSPQEPLVPLAFAQFASAAPRAGSDIRVSGFSYQDTLTRPIITFGQLSELQGLNGEPELRRLTVGAEAGDSGGPVFDSNGTVIGMLLPRPETPGRMLPDDVNFAVSSNAILSALQGAGLTGTQSRVAIPMSAEILTRVSADLTVLVSCWN
ncbi:trypsin-like peptidase domain-containing protein [Pararhodobacter oceanensis]|uniref:trypsin-like peptidase domain-containing protein n=1 Tax=Pararhodobacter oceanensis TaxID=2172121 RepID=UPI001403B031|nr:trypsin-like peptidase domain-containing protein [Pararhodobacter oceanensis]